MFKEWKRCEVGACSCSEGWLSEQEHGYHLDSFDFPSVPGRHWAVLYWNILFWSWYQNHRPGLCFSQRLLPEERLERDGFCRGPHRVSDLLSPWAQRGLSPWFVLFVYCGLGWDWLEWNCTKKTCISGCSKSKEWLLCWVSHLPSVWTNSKVVLRIFLCRYSSVYLIQTLPDISVTLQVLIATGTWTWFKSIYFLTLQDDFRSQHGVRWQIKCILFLSCYTSEIGQVSAGMNLFPHKIIFLKRIWRCLKRIQNVLLRMEVKRLRVHFVPWFEMISLISPLKVLTIFHIMHCSSFCLFI